MTEKKRITIKELMENKEKYIEKEVFLEGWVKSIRNSKNISFIDLTDGSKFLGLQIVADSNNLSDDTIKEIEKLTIYSNISLVGKVVKSLNDDQKVEVELKELKVNYLCSHDYPLQNKRQTREFLRSIAHLRPRTNLFRAIFRIRSLASFAIHKYFQENNFIYVHTPLLTTSDAEGAGEMFSVTSIDLNNLSDKDLIENKEKNTKSLNFKNDLFAKPVHLTVTGQLNGEAFASAFSNIYTFGPIFRAENSNTVKHAAEFWMIEPEMAFCDIFGLMEIAEGVIKYVVKYVLENAKDEMEFLDKFVENGLIKRLEKTRDEKFGVITYTEAIEKLKEVEDKFENKVYWGVDLQTEHERYIAEEIFKKPVFVINYPEELKAFYMKRNSDNKTVAATDLLVPGIGELIGGSQREENYDILKEKCKKFNLPLEEYDWYLDLRKYGSFKHSGFGIGFERLIMFLSGIGNIRDTIPFPRTPKNCEF